MLIVSGTIDIDTANDDETLTSALRSLAASPPPLTSVCTGAVLLARAGLLAEAHQATTDHEDIDLLADVIGDRATIARWVDSGSIVTAGGLSSGIVTTED